MWCWFRKRKVVNKNEDNQDGWVGNGRIWQVKIEDENGK